MTDASLGSPIVSASSLFFPNYPPFYFSHRRSALKKIIFIHFTFPIRDLLFPVIQFTDSDFLRYLRHQCWTRLASLHLCLSVQAYFAVVVFVFVSGILYFVFVGCVYRVQMCRSGMWAPRSTLHCSWWIPKAGWTHIAVLSKTSHKKAVDAYLVVVFVVGGFHKRKGPQTDSPSTPHPHISVLREWMLEVREVKSEMKIWFTHFAK